ncbi:MAG: ABC transporter permease [Verrucomicrobiae bacterium]|nr:ABC transporter permease [Verrucomicrobiae bacterium]
MEILVTGLKKMGVLIGVLIGASLLLFTAIHMLEGDPISLRLKNPDPETVALERERLGLDDPLPIQYVRYITEFVRGDWGRSLISQRPVAEDVFSRLTATLELTLSAMFLGILYGIPVALFASSSSAWVYRKISHGLGVIGVVVPIFWLGFILIVVGSLWLKYFPTEGRFDYTFDKPDVTGFLILDVLLTGRFELLGTVVRHLFLPSLCLSFYPAAVVINVIHPRLQDPVTRNLIVALKARGFGPIRLWLKHLLKLAGAPLITALGTNFGALLGGAVLTETVFSWPGLGSFLVGAILEKDLFVIENGFLFIILLVFTVVSVADVIANAMDPTLRKEHR